MAVDTLHPEYEAMDRVFERLIQILLLNQVSLRNVGTINATTCDGEAENGNKKQNCLARSHIRLNVSG